MGRKFPKWLQFILWIIIAWIIAGTVIFIPFLMDIWVENESQNVYKYINYIYGIKIPAIFWLLPVGFLIATFIYFYQQYSSVKDKYDQEAVDQGVTLLRKYRELREYDLQKTLNLVMKNFCNKHSSVSAVQIYRYIDIPNKSLITCRLNYVEGYVKEQTDLNGIIQHYYDIDKRLLSYYRKSIRNFLENPERNLEGLIDFIIDEFMFFENININAINEVDALKYAFLIDSYDALTKYFPETQELQLDESKVGKLETIIKKQRYGILRGIQLGVFYTFFYDGEGSKQGRQYITSPILIRDTEHIILITLDPDLLPSDKNSILEEFILEFEEMLKDTTETVYN